MKANFEKFDMKIKRKRNYRELHITKINANFQINFTRALKLIKNILKIVFPDPIWQLS